ncbi:MAG: M20/M25/M40 family metallo-hydrolase [Peptococcaceae bacterium]|jgi:endoglucanase|nr:M20/M25/M40 family metallo-hydrolase [Peptococcaceae bacterium]
MNVTDTQNAYPFLQQLTQAFGPSGLENPVLSLLAVATQGYADETYRDTLGNLYVIKRGTSGKQVMVSAHADEIGLIVTFIDTDGFLRFTTLGGVSVTNLLYRRVVFENGVSGVIAVEKLDKPGDLSLEKLYIDIGATSESDAAAKVRIGDSAVFVGEYTETQTRVISKALDNRIGCFVLSEALKQVVSPHTLVFVFTTQEEVGLRGARPAAYALDPDWAVTVDVTRTGDTPKSARMAVRLGAGVGIKVMDRAIVIAPYVKTWISEQARKQQIPHQFEVLESGGTESGAIQLTKSGIPVGVLSIPARYVHSPGEMIDKRDVASAIALLVALLQDQAGPQIPIY